MTFGSAVISTKVHAGENEMAQPVNVSTVQLLPCVIWFRLRIRQVIELAVRLPWLFVVTSQDSE